MVTGFVADYASVLEIQGDSTTALHLHITDACSSPFSGSHSIPNFDLCQPCCARTVTLEKPA